MSPIADIIVDDQPVPKAALRTALVAMETVLEAAPAVRTRPAFIEQFITGMHGRGIIDNEAINLVSQQAVAASQVADGTSLTVSDISKFDAGGGCMIRHDDGLYHPYFIPTISGSNLALLPPLRSAVTAGAQIERKHYNKAHPGKFYMRWLAQRIARATELEAAMADGPRLIFVDFASDPFAAADILTTFGGASVSEQDFENVGDTGTVASVVRFPYRSALVSFSANGAGVDTDTFTVAAPGPFVMKFGFWCSLAAAVVDVELIADDGTAVAVYRVPTGLGMTIPQIYTMTGHTRHAATIKARVKVTSGASGTSSFALSFIDAFSAPELTGLVIAKRDAKIVAAIDSWALGDEGSTVERESFCTQLALELPHATIINAGIGGNKIWQFLARFDADVAVHRPDYVIVNTGTNEQYGPGSSVFDPNALVEFRDRMNDVVNKITGIGARPILIGVPAGAQNDPTDAPLELDGVTPMAPYRLNERARAYTQFQRRYQTRLPALS